MQGGDSPAPFGMDYEDTDLEEVTDDERKKRKKKPKSLDDKPMPELVCSAYFRSNILG